MGFIDSSPEAETSVFYNVVHAVGQNCPNLSDDVKLVQYLLKTYYDAVSPNFRPNGNLTVDGVCGAITRNWILKFQLDCRYEFPGEILADGRVDRVRNQSLKGSISKTTYTLSFLNSSAAHYNPEGWKATPLLIPLQNPANVPPPSVDVVNETQVVKPRPTTVPTVAGGF
jgi:hypothetical protein